MKQHKVDVRLQVRLNPQTQLIEARILHPLDPREYTVLGAVGVGVRTNAPDLYAEWQDLMVRTMRRCMGEVAGGLKVNVIPPVPPEAN